MTGAPNSPDFNLTSKILHFTKSSQDKVLSGTNLSRAKHLDMCFVHTCPAEFSIPTALRWPIHVHYSFSLSSMDHDFFYPHRPRRTPLQLATYAFRSLKTKMDFPPNRHEIVMCTLAQHSTLWAHTAFSSK